MLLNCGVGEDSWESLGLQGDPTNPSYRKSVLNIHWKDWCWSWSSNTLAIIDTLHLILMQRTDSLEKILIWCWERLRARGEGDGKGGDGWMASPIRWTWVWISSRSWWWTRRPGVLQSMRLLSWTRLSNWTDWLKSSFWYVVVQLLSCVQLFVTPWAASTPGLPVLHYLL